MLFLVVLHTSNLNHPEDPWTFQLVSLCKVKSIKINSRVKQKHFV